MRILTVLLLFGCFVLSAHAQNGLSAKDIEAVKQVEKKLEAAFLKGDQAAAMSLVWNDAAFYPNGIGTFKGIDGIKKVWFPTSDSVHTLSKYAITLDEIYGENRMAVAIGTNDIAWTATTPGKPDQKFTALRHFVTIYSKRNGEWRIFRRHWHGKLQEVK